jgi:dipeptidyl aminopeptidase/acylaminoacyl peptidase
MKDERVRRLLDSPAPGEQEAEDRGWQVVRGAFAERDVPARRSRPIRGLIALGAALALIGAAFTPPGQAVTDWVRDAVEPGRDDARPALVSLPAPGRVLVTSQQGPWIVAQDGSRRLLGAFDDASWSPGGLFVIATRGRELVAVDPKGRPRWSLARPALVSDARWSPDGFRIAYSSGNDLRVVAGDGTGDASVAENVADVAPAWRPGPGHRLAFADRTGRVRLVETDSGSVVWRSREGPAPTQLAWSLDGRLLLAVAPTELRLFDAGGRLVSTLDMPPATFADSATFRPTSDGFALATHALKGDRSRLALVRFGKGATVERVLLSGVGRFGDLAWSPDGQWLLATWPSANQWVFIRAGDRRRSGTEKLLAVANIAQQFAPGSIERPGFPGLGGWCCPTLPAAGRPGP